MSDLLRNILRFAVFILIQVLLLNKIPHLHRFITPYIYFLFLLWLPFSVSRQWLLIIGFLTGLTLDYFTMTPGLHTAACLLIAYVRPFLISVLMPKDSSDFNYREPSPKAMLWTPYLVYVFVLTLLHHGYMVFLQWLSFGSFLDFIIKVIATTAISMLLIITVELLFPRKMKFRTNTS
ncbi:MAG: rod shape-determining protein MreD [Chitinophagaceae bacterium]|nr:rod shape-determining protein MreD [Chitinophagaceae bacterium]MBK8309928.1 rod shape-determining protein MreD [Chitinophagaceae bacterium]MBP6476551.1 rod shape-determining protein MreD [Chitinophagaceae bacterium]MBP7108274.1 rod shape-determining protein MreD [Chitinophagaceae bacterium]MBP7314913.1 rod shape-determining protein MreD [Chitinophagaceae bacterium]